ncbi:MAG: hypothetical protein MI924_36940 [Chloroflexales bacterium]|nr:hypothetical protein [Chloroflexales bacterium]
MNRQSRRAGAIHPRQHQQPVLAVRPRGPMADILLRQCDYGQRQGAAAFPPPLGGGAARSPTRLAGVEPGQRLRLRFRGQVLPDAVLPQAQHPHGDGQPSHQPGDMVRRRSDRRGAATTALLSSARGDVPPGTGRGRPAPPVPGCMASPCGWSLRPAR